MPTISVDRSDLEKLINMKIPEDKLYRFFLPVKGELDGVEGNILKIDAKDSNRPDLWSSEGIARELNLHMNGEKLDYEFDNSDYEVKIEGLKGIREIGAYAIVKDVNIDDTLLENLIQMQEKICLSFGKKRKEIAIGIFDLDKIEGKKLKYFSENKNREFVALGNEKEQSLEEILENHQKGKMYGHLIKDFEKYPLLVDEKNNVLSMPPIINSENSGRVTTNTKNLFIDVTGINFENVNSALLIVCMALKDRGAKVQKVKTIYENEHIYTPKVEWKNIKFSKSKIYDYFEEISDEKIEKLLSKKGYKTEFVNDDIIVHYLNYRLDILHPVDIIEDLLISVGFENINVSYLNTQTLGKTLEKTDLKNIIREIGIGLGLQEVMTFTLTSKKKQIDMINEEDNVVEIENPMSENISIFRRYIFPEHLEFLSKNQHISYPQNIFELGEVLHLLDDKIVEKNHFLGTLCSNNISYSNVQEKLNALLKNLGAKNIRYVKEKYPFFIEGRCAKVLFELNGLERVGFLGEVHPRVLSDFNLEMPVAIFEVDLI